MKQLKLSLLACFVLLFLIAAAPPLQDPQLPTDLAITDTEWAPTEDNALLIHVQVTNLSDTLSPESELHILSEWEPQSQLIPSLKPGENIVLEFALPIPDDVRGTPQELVIEIDPEGRVRETNRENNVEVIVVNLPVVLTIPNTPTPPPTPIPPPPPTSDVSGDLLVALVIGATVLVGVGAVALTSALLITRSVRRGRRKKNAKPDQPPDHCTPGQRYTQVEPEAQPRLWYVTQLEIYFQSLNGQVLQNWSAEQKLIKQLNRRIRQKRLRRSPDDTLIAAPPPESLRLASQISKSVSAVRPYQVALVAKLEGSEVGAQFTHYRCRKNVWVKVASWTATTQLTQDYSGTILTTDPAEDMSTLTNRLRLEVNQYLVGLINSAV